jgi:hypothetical protein
MGKDDLDDKQTLSCPCHALSKLFQAKLKILKLLQDGGKGEQFAANSVKPGTDYSYAARLWRD